ncbi:unnamed protein product [Leptosia nina]|uniref:Uncharacterized protein n=1 Tax=Leptosia nina TaxID=320188 RepID=A0AAV1JFT0_9NEOP
MRQTRRVIEATEKDETGEWLHLRFVRRRSPFDAVRVWERAVETRVWVCLSGKRELGSAGRDELAPARSDRES